MWHFQGRKITGVTNDSRKVLPGHVFVAIKGLAIDGHQFIDQALANGAALVVSEEELDKSIPWVKVSNSRAVFARLARIFNNCPDKELVTIGVTGTNGKTTVTTLLSHILNYNNYNTGLIGTNGISFGKFHWKTILTTPDAGDLYRHLAQMVKQNVKAVAMEVSSHALKLQRVEGMGFNIAVFTNLSLDHLDLHHTYQDYLETKLLLFAKMKPGGLMVYNKDDLTGNGLGGKVRSAQVAYSMRDSQADVLGIIKQITPAGVTLDVQVKPCHLPYAGTFSVGSSLLGEHNVSNLLAAICCALAVGFAPREIVAGMATFRGVKRRLEVIYNSRFTVIDDFCHNPANYDAVLKVAETLPHNRLYLVTPIRGNRGELVNRENAKVISRWGKKLGVNQVIVSNCEDTAQSKDQVSPKEEIAFLKPLWQAGLKVDHTATLTQAIKLVMKNVGPGDLILLLGSHPFNNVAKLVRAIINSGNLGDVENKVKHNSNGVFTLSEF